jgi:hypothetical protein
MKGLVSRVTAALLAIAGSWSLAPPAQACGIWHFEDQQTGKTASFWVGSILVGKQGQRERAMALVSADQPRRCSVGDVHLVLRGGRFVAGGRTHAVLDGATVKVGRRAFAIRIDDIPADKRTAPMYAWTVEVREGDALVGGGTAMSFHLCDREDASAARRDITERVACYLTARSLAGTRPR